MSAQPKQPWSPLAADLACILDDTTPNARAALWAETRAVAQCEITGRLPSPEAITGADVIWGAAAVMGLREGGDPERILAPLCVALVDWLAARHHQDPKVIKRRLWAYVLDLRAERAARDPNAPAFDAQDIAGAYLRLRRDLSDATRANADLAAAEARAAAGHTYSANGSCKDCAERVHWRMCDDGKSRPHNLDGNLHHPTCTRRRPR